MIQSKRDGGYSSHLVTALVLSVIHVLIWTFNLFFYIYEQVSAREIIDPNFLSSLSTAAIGGNEDDNGQTHVIYYIDDGTGIRYVRQTQNITDANIYLIIYYQI